MFVVGVDGCRGGWVAAEWNTRKQAIQIKVFASFTEVLSAYPEKLAKAIAVDIPIGLIDGSRKCDIEARAALICRKSSVFPAPYRSYVNRTDYHTTNEDSKKQSGKGISSQAFGIYRKVAEVDGIVIPEFQSRVVEVHPEICFWAMNNKKDVCASKHSGPGHLQRIELLRKNIDLQDLEWEKVMTGVRGAKPDDVLDAIAAAWSARRWANGSFERFPAKEERDSRGFRAEIVY